MKRLLTLIIIHTFAISVSVHAQNIESALRSMPDTVMPLLTHNNVLDFIDYLSCGMKAEVTNKLGGKTEMTKLTESYSHIMLTDVSDLQLKCLKTENGNIIAIVHTVFSDNKVADSSISFYSASWDKLSAKDLFCFADDTNFCHYTFSPENDDLTISFCNPMELEENVKPRNPVTLKWNGKVYK